MIEATILRDEGRIYGFRILGHAESVPEGQNDLVCCAVSVLAENTVNAIERLTEDCPLVEEMDEEEGFLQFELPKQCSEKSRLLLDAMALGLEDIAEQSEKHLTIRSKEE